MTASNNGPAMQGHLHHLQILSPDPQALAEFYARCLGMSVRPLHQNWVCQGPQRGLIIAPGPAAHLGFAAFAVSNSSVLLAIGERVRSGGVDVQNISTPLLQSGSIGFSDPDGNCFVFGLPTETPAPSSDGLPGRLQHVVLASTNAERMLSFYCDVVGFRLSDRVIDDAGALRTCFLRTDDEHHSLAIFQADENRLDHHCYESPDWNSIRDWGDHFASIRVPVEWGPGRHGPGNNLFVFVHDPDGNWIEISAELEVVKPDRPIGAWPHEERTLNSWGRGVLRS